MAKQVKKKKQSDKAKKKEEEKFKQYAEYENSLEGVWDDLRVLSTGTVEDEKDKMIIAETLLRLPYKIRRKTLDEVVFVIMSIGGTLARATFPVAAKKTDFKKSKFGEFYYTKIKQPLILLNLKGKVYRYKSQKMNTIAHEIAHFILRHYSPFKIRISQKENIRERKADDLSEKWGFKRCYKNYDL